MPDWIILLDTKGRKKLEFHGSRVQAWCVHGATLPADRVTKIGRNAGSLELYFFFAFSN